MKSPRVSVLLPTHNGGEKLLRSVASVQKQNFTDWELVIINDASTDDTPRYISMLQEKDARVLVLENDKNLGIQKSLNRGLSLAHGEYIARIDDDDEWVDKDKLKKQIDFLDKEKAYVLVGTGVILVDEKGLELTRYLMPEKDRDIRKKILRMNPFVHPSVVFRKKEVLDIDGYREEKLSEDHDLWLRLGRENKFANIPDFCVKYRMSLSGLNSQNKLRRLRQNMLFAKENKDFYPNYYLATFIGWLKIFFLPLFFILPRNLKGFFLKLHKKI